MTRRHAEKDASARPVMREQRAKAGAGRTARGKLEAAPAEKTVPRQSEAQLLARLATLERERDALTAEVQSLQQRCRQLEDTTAHVRNRLAWAIDSVESVLQNKG
jgi:predicted  nucleic acid-binding Zn-ribbon protein